MANNNYFLSPPSKRPFMADSLAPPLTTTAANGTSVKRSKKQPPPMAVPAGHASFRMLCHVSSIGGFIGKSGSTIKQLQLDTESKIRVEDSLQPGSDHRVIVIVASSSPVKRLVLREEYEVSAVQEAVVRVFEKVLEVSDGAEGDNTVSCRLLVDASQAGSVIGKGGKVVEQLRRESGAKIRVLLDNHLPPGVSSPDEVVEIEGDALAVKKALIGVSGHLQECLQGEKPSIKESRPLESTSQSISLDFCVDPPQQRTPISLATTSSSPALARRPIMFESHDFRVDPPLQRTPISITTTSLSPALARRPISYEADGFTTSDSKLQQQEVVFKILCSNDKVGGIIGRGGAIVRALQDESGATIHIGAAVANCDERLISITSKEDVESRYSPAQRAAVLIFSRSIEAGVEKGLDKGSSVTARLVVPSNQAGCLLGKGGVIVSQMRKETGAGISIIRGDQVPKCASGDDEVVEISGQFVKVQDALYQVTSRLRDNILSSKVINIPGSGTNTSLRLDRRVEEPTYTGLYQSSSTSQSVDRQATIRQGLAPLLHPHRLDKSPSPGLRTSEIAAGINTRSIVNFGRGLSANGYGGVELGSSNRPAIVTNTTVEILVPESSVSSVYGENGNNLARIRQISGAKVVVHEARPGTRDRTVIISGTPDETQAAQSLLHAFILTGPS